MDVLQPKKESINVVISCSDINRNIMSLYKHIFDYLKSRYIDSKWFIREVNMYNRSTTTDKKHINGFNKTYPQIKYWGLFNENLLDFVSNTDEKIDVLFLCEGSKSYLLSKYNENNITDIKKKMNYNGDIKILNEGVISEFVKFNNKRIIYHDEIYNMLKFMDDDTLLNISEAMPSYVDAIKRQYIPRQYYNLSEYLTVPELEQRMIKKIIIDKEYDLKTIPTNEWTHLAFLYNYNQKIDKNMLPNGLTHLTFGNNYNQSIDKDVLPSELTHLTFGRKFNKKIYKDVLPNGLSHLTVGCKYKQKLDKDVLPVGLTHLTFGDQYNQKFDKDVLPIGLTHLTFGDEYNQKFDKDVLPVGLTHLTFGNEYNQKFDKDVLSDKLLQLTFGFGYNKPFSGDILPDSLTHLTFGYEYNHPLDENILSNNLEYLTLGKKYNLPIFQDWVPDNLIQFKIGNKTWNRK